MKYFLVFILWLMILPGCTMRQREKDLDKKSAEVNQKEQQLLLKETALSLKEEELNNREKALDSTMKIVSPEAPVGSYNVSLVGNWTVDMRCVETDCAGSAIGDTKIEQWEISYMDGSYVVKAMADKKLIRIYTGSYMNNMLRLTSRHDDLPAGKVTTMNVRLHSTKDKEMEGEREILRPENCKILYMLQLKKH